jgi:VCBS repeat-containing protein
MEEKENLFKKVGVVVIASIFMLSAIIPTFNALNIGINNNISEELSTSNSRKYYILNDPDVWEVTLEFNETGGAFDNVSFGEKTNASDDQDIYDVPKSSPGISPYIRAWFNTSFSDPYDELGEEYKYYPATSKLWNLTIQWVPSDNSSSTTLNISWNATLVNTSEYNSVVLYSISNSTNISNMLVQSNYSFSCPASTLQYFKIICKSNLPPVANDDTATVSEDSTNNQINVLSNDNDPNGDNLTIISVSNPPHGAASTNGSFVFYTPDPNYNGADSFTYSISDGNNESDTATVNITVASVNDPPIANNDYYTTTEDTTLNIPAPGILTNDTDIENNPLTAIQQTGTTNGILTLNSNGSFKYIPNPNYNGPDTYTYRAYDGTNYSNIATVHITISPTNDPPIANNDYYTTIEDTTLNIPAPGILTNDTDIENNPLTATLNISTTNGTLTLQNNGSFTYTPNPSYNGQDTFTYRVYDGTNYSNIATVHITISPTNDPPIANNDYYTTIEDTTLNIPAPGILTNDTDPDGDPLIAEIITYPLFGNLTFNSTGSFIYVPNENYSGYDNFTYWVYDGTNYSNIAIVYITIININNPPIANDDNFIVEEDSDNNKLNVLLNDFDNDGDNLTIISITQPNHGSAFYDGKFVYYTPSQYYIGNDSFEYIITDGHNGIDTATIYVNIIFVNHPPEKPIINGPQGGVVNNIYKYAFVTNDHENDDLFYEILWGDGEYEQWKGPYKSDQAVTFNHTWTSTGLYTISARAKDTKGAVSEWSTFSILIPKNKATIKNIIINILERILDKFIFFKDIVYVLIQKIGGI